MQNTASNSRSRFRAILEQRCPVCLEGKVFESLWRMHERCPHCETVFRREGGYFLGALYYSYGMGCILLIPLGVLSWNSDIPIPVIGILAMIQTALFSPLLFRYSRVLWLHMDQRFDPR